MPCSKLPTAQALSNWWLDNPAYGSLILVFIFVLIFQFGFSVAFLAVDDVVYLFNPGRDSESGASTLASLQAPTVVTSISTK